MLEGTVMDTAEIFDLQYHIVLNGVLHRRIYIGKFTSYHLVDDFIIADVFDFPGSYISTITHDGDIIGDLTDLSHLVGDVDHGYASGFKIPHDAEQRLYLVIGKGRCRLVEDHYFRAHGYCFCDLYRLHLRNGKRSQFCLWIIRHFYILQPFGCFFIHGLVVDDL